MIEFLSGLGASIRVHRKAVLLVIACLLLVGALLAAPALFNAGPASVESNFARIVSSGTLRVCLDPSFPPFEVTGEGGTIIGLDADLAKELASRMGLRPDFVLTGFDALYADLAAQHCDVIISALPYDMLRTRDVAYSDVYFRGGAELIVRASDADMKGIADARGRLIGVELGTSAETTAKQMERRDSFQIVRFNSLEDAARSLDSGAVRGVVADAVSARLILHAHPQLKIVDEPLSDEPNYVIAMPVDSPALLETVNRHLRGMAKDGTLKTFEAQWF
jgi:polar amino acid transport system substrate-binding protein